MLSSQSEPISRGRRTLLAVLGAAGFMAQLDLFVVNLALPDVGRSFGAELGALSWVLNAYAIVFAALLVPAGRLADQWGRRRVLLAGVALFTVASLACALAPSLPVLVAARVVQAVGAAALLPTSLALLAPAFPPSDHHRVVGIWAGVAAVAASAGPPLGGLLVALDWRLIFLVNVPVGIAVVLVGRRVLPGETAGETAPHSAARAPSLGSTAAVLAAVGLLVLAAVELPERGWDGLVLAAAAGAALAAAAAVRSTRRGARPLVEADLFATAAFRRAAVTLLLFFVAFGAWLLAGVLFLQDEWGYSALRAGLAFAPGPVAAAVFALNSGRITARLGARAVAVTGCLLVAAAGVYWLLAAPTEPSYLTGFLPAQVAGGIGSGLAQAPLFAAAAALPARRAGTGSAFLTMCRQVGSALGVAGVVIALGAAPPGRSYDGAWLLVAVAAAAAALSARAPRSRVTA